MKIGIARGENMLDKLMRKLFKEEKETMSKQTKVDIKGSMGELRQEMRLHKLDRESYKVINNIIIPYKDKTSQIDHLVISRYGIFVIENKNFSGSIYGSEKDRNWTQVRGGSRNSFYNPVLQNRGHIKALADVFGNEDKMYSIIVFGDRAELRKIDVSGKGIRVINEHKLYDTIVSYEEVLLGHEEVKECWNMLLDSMRSIRQDVVAHVKSVKETIEENGKVCPRCKSDLVKREGKYGEFLGCSSYPKCRYVFKQNV